MAVAGFAATPRPRVLEGWTDRVETPLGSLFVTVNFLDGRPFELFATIGKAGSDVDAMTDAIARLVSLALRAGVDPEAVIDQMEGIGGSRSVGFGPNRVRSVPDAIAKALREAARDGLGAEEPVAVPQEPRVDREEPVPPDPDLCPQCGAGSLVHEEGCAHCESCGWSRC